MANDKDILDAGMEQLLVGIGVPPDLFKDGQCFSSAGAALKQFEAEWKRTVYYGTRSDVPNPLYQAWMEATCDEPIIVDKSRP